MPEAPPTVATDASTTASNAAWDRSAGIGIVPVWCYPFQTRASGREEIVAEWMRERDAFEGGSFDAKCFPVAIEDDRVVAHGRTVFYEPGSDRVVTAYDNIWFLRFDEAGRCSEFHEWYAGRPEDEPDRAVPLHSLGNQQDVQPRA